MNRIPTLAVLTCMAVAIGCKTYESEAPPVDQRDKRDKGLQSKDVVDASDLLAQYLLQLPEFNQPVRRTVVVTNVENKTSDPNFNYDIFIQRLRTNLGQHGRDRIVLLDNRRRIAGLREEELEGNPAAHAPVDPEFALYGVISDLPQRGTNYYFCEFTVTNLKTREQIPLKPYEVKVAR